jgi:hypothetical protein
MNYYALLTTIQGLLGLAFEQMPEHLDATTKECLEENLTSASLSVAATQAEYYPE